MSEICLAPKDYNVRFCVVDPDFKLISLRQFLSREIQARNAKGPKEMAPEFGAPPPWEPSLVSRRPPAGGFRNFGAPGQHRTCTGTRTGLGPPFAPPGLAEGRRFRAACWHPSYALATREAHHLKTRGNWGPHADPHHRSESRSELPI